MPSLMRNYRLRLAIAAVYVLAMSVLGLAHRPIFAAPTTADLAAYVLPDGSVPNLCLPGEEEQGQHHVGVAGCDACLLTAAPGLPAAGATLPEPVGDVVAGLPDERDQHLPASLERGPTSRGPPLARAA